MQCVCWCNCSIRCCSPFLIAFIQKGAERRRIIKSWINYNSLYYFPLPLHELSSGQEHQHQQKSTNTRWKQQSEEYPIIERTIEHSIDGVDGGGSGRRTACSLPLSMNDCVPIYNLCNHRFCCCSIVLLLLLILTHCAALLAWPADPDDDAAYWFQTMPIVCHPLEPCNRETN